MHEHTVITLTFKNCAQFIKCVRKINNKQLDNAKDIDSAISMYNLLEYSNIYSKPSWILRQYCRDEAAANVVNGNIFDFIAANTTTNLFKTKEKITKNDNRKP